MGLVKPFLLRLQGSKGEKQGAGLLAEAIKVAGRRFGHMRGCEGAVLEAGEPEVVARGGGKEGGGLVLEGGERVVMQGPGWGGGGGAGEVNCFGPKLWHGCYDS